METMESVPAPKPAKKVRTSRPKAKPKAKPIAQGYSELVISVSNWRPSNPNLTRNLLVQELRAKLEDDRFTCINSCVPALIADGAFPIEVMHFRHRDDIDEFVTRMVWMHEVFKSTIGVLIGVPDQETSELVMSVCGTLLKMDENCTVIIH